FFLMLWRPPSSTLFPYTTLFRSHPEIPGRFALQGFAGVRAFERRRGASDQFLTATLGFRRTGDDAYESRGASRGSFYIYDAAPEDRKSTRLNSSHDQISYAVFCL